uniref:Nucelotide kinase n=1 Tax=Siphoviridae sp. cteEQ43 TaxID=2827905 RepID=A0A8S5TC70_9CAUD|nr:MAG TPA: nucelotide kinase [Siphoviridae sp. cteEQ43]
MLTDVELNEIADTINDYCYEQSDFCDDGMTCGVKPFCDNCNGCFGAQYPDDTIDAYTWLQEHGYVDKQEDGVEHDAVEHPSHYTHGGVECLDAIEAALSSQDDPYRAFLTGQVLKYMWRWPMKNGLEDCRKAKFYLDRLIADIEANQLPL